jgi:hypothetical protein
MRVTLYDVQFDNADNLDILLVGPTGRKILLMADAGGPGGLLTPATITFKDSAGVVLPNSSTINTGVYEATSWESGQTSFPAPAPAAPYSEPGSTVGGTPNLSSVFGGTPSNGVWSLYVRDDGGSFTSPNIASGTIGGWGLHFFAATAASAEISGRVMTAEGNGIRNATVMLTGGNLTEPLYARTGTFGNYNFNDLPVGQTFVVTVLSRRYIFSSQSRTVSLVGDASSVDFVANPN